MCVSVRHKSGEKGSISNVRHFVGENDINMSRTQRDRKRASLSPNSKATKQDCFPDVFSLAFEMRRREFSREVHDANARAGNEIGTNSSNAKTRKAFTQEDVSKRLKRLREDLTRANTDGSDHRSERNNRRDSVFGGI